jgi:epoxyqueuosine reductase
MLHGVFGKLALAFSGGERAALVPVERLEELRADLARLAEGEDLNGFQRWIIGELYDFDTPADFEARSAIIVAVPHPFCAQVEFAVGGRAYRCLSLVMSDFARAEASLRAALPATSRLASADKLPLKRLASRCGLARYGRNNVCYVEGMGSSLSFAAFYSDMPCAEGEWTEPRIAPACSGCGRCVEACPTGAIRRDRFLIDNERCLSAMNESAEPFPDWLDEGVHHTLYDCLRCQEACPMNASRRRDTGDPVSFGEEETALLLAGAKPGLWPPELVAKARYLGMDKWPDGLAKNLRAIMRAQGGEAAG